MLFRSNLDGRASHSAGMLTGGLCTAPSDLSSSSGIQIRSSAKSFLGVTSSSCYCPANLIFFTQDLLSASLSLVPASPTPVSSSSVGEEAVMKTADQTDAWPTCKRQNYK